MWSFVQNAIVNGSVCDLWIISSKTCDLMFEETAVKEQRFACGKSGSSCVYVPNELTNMCRCVRIVDKLHVSVVFLERTQ